MMIKFIASDIDGTLLPPGKEALSPRIFELILELKKLGIPFAAASGRQYQSLRHLFEPIKEDISYIAENGSLCIHQGQVLSRGIIERALGLEILDAIHAYQDCSCILSCESKMYTDGTDAAFISHLQNVINYQVDVVTDLRDIQEDFLKIAIYSKDGTKKMQDHFKSIFKDRIKIVTSGNMWVDFIAPNANKATALEVLANHLHFDPQDLVVFGDQYNDVEMLQYAGTSYAMSNAAPGVSYYSTYVTDSVEEVLEDILANAKIPHS